MMTDSEFKQEFSERLKMLRKRAKLSQKKLGLKMGLAETTAERTIQRWEYMERSPGMEYSRPLANALDCTLEELIP